MRFRWKLLILLLVTAITPMLFMRANGGNALSQIRQTLAERASADVRENAEDRLSLLVRSSSVTLTQRRQMAEVILRLVATQAGRALAGREVEPMGMPMSGSMSKSMSGMDERMVWRGRSRDGSQDAAHGRGMGFFMGPGARDDEATREAMSRLEALDVVYEQLAEAVPEFPYYAVIALENGLMSIYPKPERLPGRYDPRESEWYRAGMAAEPGEIARVFAFVDVASRQSALAGATPVLSEEGERIGVAGLILPIVSNLAQSWIERNLSPSTGLYLVDWCGSQQDGPSLRVLASLEPGESTRRSWRAAPQERSLNPGDPAMLDDCESDREGVVRTDFEGRDSLWVYGPVTARSSLVAIVPYEEIETPARELSAFVSAVIERQSTTINIIFGVVVLAIVVAGFAFSRTVTRPLEKLSAGARRMAAGDLSARVDIRGSDELAEMGRVFNEVAPQLEKHMENVQNLALAQEVQQNLLPAGFPTVAGLDAAATVRYHDETGGDCWDVMPLAGERIAVWVGDVTGHGMAAALLMATARGLLRDRMYVGGRLGEVVQDVNAQLTPDVWETGRFMTLFVAELGLRDNVIHWVRAGHDPALVYDPGQDAFSELMGDGLALGLDEAYPYAGNEQALEPGAIVVIGTDGLWEARNAAGEMMDKERLREIIRTHAGEPAQAIVEALMAGQREHLGDLDPEDDVTLVVLKLT